jgi:hypothetical protein
MVNSLINFIECYILVFFISDFLEQTFRILVPCQELWAFKGTKEWHRRGCESGEYVYCGECEWYQSTDLKFFQISADFKN